MTKHLRQVEMYAVNEGVEWVILTNGAKWQVYHIGVMAGAPVLMSCHGSRPARPEPSNVKADALLYISKEAFKRHMIDDLWREKVASSPRSLASTILSETVVDAIQKELRRRTSHRSQRPRFRGFSFDRDPLGLPSKTAMLHDPLHDAVG